MIRFDGVTMEFEEGVEALHDVSFTIKPGEFVFFVGASGAGKSTVIRLLLRELKPTAGSVEVNGYKLPRLPHRRVPQYRRTIGVVFQDFRLLPKKTVFENVAFAKEVVGASRREIRTQVPVLCSMVGLGDKLNAYPHQLSGGEQQRTAVARALANNPSILIADEPTGNLDPDTSKEIMKILNMINRRGTTVLVATHDKDIVNSMRKRVITLKQGKLVRDQEKGRYCDEL
jgi:cell division transport system ATP-binding protein